MLSLEFLFKTIVTNFPKDCEARIDLLIYGIVIIFYWAFFIFFSNPILLRMMAIASMLFNQGDYRVSVI